MSTACLPAWYIWIKSPGMCNFSNVQFSRISYWKWISSSLSTLSTSAIILSIKSDCYSSSNFFIDLIISKISLKCPKLSRVTMSYPYTKDVTRFFTNLDNLFDMIGGGPNATTFQLSPAKSGSCMRSRANKQLIPAPRLWPVITRFLYPKVYIRSSITYFT